MNEVLFWAMITAFGVSVGFIAGLLVMVLAFVFYKSSKHEEQKW